MNMLSMSLGLMFYLIESNFLPQSSHVNTESTMNTKVPSVINDKSAVVIAVTEDDSHHWAATNDGVMGGLSTGGMLFSHDHGVFTGNISLANNGGFSSVYRDVASIPNDIDTVIIDIEGDGHTYQLRLALNLNGYRVAYKHDFITQVGVREQVVFSLKNFHASYRGKIILDAPVISPGKIKEVGFLIANKVSGRFALAVHNISFVHSKLE